MKIFLASLMAMLPLTTTAAELLPHSASGANDEGGVLLNTREANALVEMMRTNHPALRAQAWRTRAAGHATNSVRTWADPMLSFGGAVSDGARGPELEREGNLIYQLEQALPLFGKPAAARTIARRELEAEVTRTTLEFQTLRRDLLKTLVTLAYEDQSLAIGRQDLLWLETMTAVAEGRYRSGAGSQVEILRMQNERAKRADVLLTDTRRRDQLRVSLNRLLGRDLQSAVSQFQLPPLSPPLVVTPGLLEMATNQEPRLRLLAAEIQVAEAQTVATRKARLPEVGGFLEGRQYSGDGGFRMAAVGVKLSLPWFNGSKYQSDLARDRARVEAARFEADNTAQLVLEGVRQLGVEIDAAYRQAVLYRDEILPRSELALEAAHANWMNNRGMFIDVMEARRLLLEARLTLARSISDQYRAMSELLVFCGLDDWEALNAASRSEPLQPPAITR